MMNNHRYRFLMALFIPLAVGLFLISSCDSGEKVIDEVTGNRAVKQYHKTKKDLDQIADKQAQRYQSIPDNNNEDEEQR